MTRRTNRNRLPMFDRMEDRKLLSFTTSLTAGVLTIRGNGGNDNVTVVERNGQVELDGRSQRGAKTGFASGTVDRIVFDGGAGNDRFTNTTGVPVTASGGRGNDVLIGGGGADDLNGNEGNDIIHGGAGDDFVRGGSGKDSLSGDDGKDSLAGESGDDRLHGDAGDDSLLGGSGNDSLFGDDGNDHLDDHQGRNRLDGGLGSDDVAGGHDLHGSDPGDVNHDVGDDHGGNRSMAGVIVPSEFTPLVDPNSKKDRKSRS